VRRPRSPRKPREGDTASDTPSDPREAAE
jgi:hypothetical protein